MKIGIAGCKGRMGKVLTEYFSQTGGVQVIGGTERAGLTANVLAELSDAIIDFTTPEHSLDIAKQCAANKVIHICGTTGFTQDNFNTLNSYAKETLILQANNMSIGVNIVAKMVEQAASILDNEFDIEVIEAHHRKKVDSPSGTALMLGKAAAKGRGIDFNKHAKLSREGIIGPRPKDEIGFSTIRGGSIIGKHNTMFISDNETVEIQHTSYNRDIYAAGSYKALLWLQGKQPNKLYSMADVIEY